MQLRQEAFGVPVFRDEIRIAMNRAYEPVAVAGYLPSVVGLSEPVFALAAGDALVRALADFGIAGLTPADVENLGAAPGGYERLGLAGARRGLLAAPVRAKKVLFHLPERLEPGLVPRDRRPDGASRLRSLRRGPRGEGRSAPVSPSPRGVGRLLVPRVGRAVRASRCPSTGRRAAAAIPIPARRRTGIRLPSSRPPS